MRQLLLLAVFTLATLVCAAQQPQANRGQATSPQAPTATQSQPSSPGSAAQGSAQTASAPQSQAANMPITEGCLGGTNPNFTITDKAGTTYKLNMPANADASPLSSHIGESVQVLGSVNNAGGAGKASSVDVSRIGRGTGNCAGGTSKQPAH